MRYMAIDIGEKRCGLAVSDERARIATPLSVVSLADAVNNAGDFSRAVEEYRPVLLICGLPLSLSGEEGRQSHRIRTIAGQISRATGIPHEFVDERLSSSQAKDVLREMGYDEKRMRGKVDMVAASLFLQTWLDARPDHPEA